jgi:hypothetical protein
VVVADKNRGERGDGWLSKGEKENVTRQNANLPKIEGLLRGKGAL